MTWDMRKNMNFLLIPKSPKVENVRPGSLSPYGPKQTTVLLVYNLHLYFQKKTHNLKTKITIKIKTFQKRLLNSVV